MMMGWTRVILSSFVLGLVLTRPLLAAEYRIVVDEIKVDGATALNSQEVDAAVEVDVGDYLERAAVARSVTGLESMLHAKGYRRATVTSEVLKQSAKRGPVRTVLRFIVNEGRPALVSSVDLVLNPLATKPEQAAWEKIREYLRSKVPIKSGAILDNDRIEETKKSLENAIVEREYIGGKVVLAESQVTDEAVKLSFEVTLGDRVSFGFRGNIFFDRNQLLELITEQKGLGFGKDYIRDIRAKLIESYKSHGFPQVEVKVFTFEKRESAERHVTYAIHEGDRIRVESIDFEGNFVFTEKELLSKLNEFSSPIVLTGYYVESDIDKSVDLMIEWMQSRGYLSAKKVTVSRTFSYERRSARVLIYVYEGDQTIIKNVTIEGADKFSREEILKTVGTKVDEPLNLFAFSEGLEKLKSDYRDKGYLDMKIENEESDNVVQYFQQNRFADVYLKIYEGPQFRVSKIWVDGLQNTKEFIVLRELRFKEGDVVEGELVRESEARLRKIGFFSSAVIQFRDDPDKPGYKLVRVLIQEGSAGLYGTGIGYRNDLGGRVFGELSYTNLWQRNHTVALSAATNRRIEGYRPSVGMEFEIKTAYIWPWFLLSELTFKPELSFQRQQFIQFAADTLSLRPTWEKRLLRKTNLVASFMYSLERTVQYDAGDERDNQTLRIGAVIPSLRLDLRDNPLSPTSGLLSMISYEHASTMFFSQLKPFPVAYERVQFRSDYFVPLLRGMTWYLSFRSGFSRNLVPQPPAKDQKDPRVGIPLIKQFALGGVGSLRGFKVEELNSQSDVPDKVIQGTLTYVNYRTQLDFPIAGSMRFGPFIDAANLLVDRYSFGMLRYGVGVGLHYQTPVGPVNFDWGFKVDPRPNEDTSQFHFSIGVL